MTDHTYDLFDPDGPFTLIDTTISPDTGIVVFDDTGLRLWPGYEPAPWQIHRPVPTDPPTPTSTDTGSSWNPQVTYRTVTYTRTPVKWVVTTTRNGRRTRHWYRGHVYATNPATAAADVYTIAAALTLGAAA